MLLPPIWINDKTNRIKKYHRLGIFLFAFTLMNGINIVRGLFKKRMIEMERISNRQHQIIEYLLKNGKNKMS